jgi:acyl-CoA reductase-like NAD-dependent aldehyde dehydrogenase
MGKEAQNTDSIPVLPAVSYPSEIGNWIDNKECKAVSGEIFSKLSPATGEALCRVARSGKADVHTAVESAKRAQIEWAQTTPVRRGDVLRATALIFRERAHELAKIVALETGKSVKDALGEVGAAVEMGFFVAGEGRRFYGKTTTSAVPHKAALVIRQPLGVAGLIIAANTPIANVAWKVFPALLCGNAAVLKSSEDTPLTAWVCARIFGEAGVPPGVLNVVHGYGVEAGAPLVDHPDVAVVSFTGSTEVGRLIQKNAGARLAKVCLELGGKNPLIVCDDADLDKAVEATVLSACSNAGQRCAAGTRIIVFDAVYETFKAKLLERTRMLKVGCQDTDDFGPVINEEQVINMVAAVEKARAAGALLLTGGKRMLGPAYSRGYFMEPTVLEDSDPLSEISRTELFGPICCLYRVRNFEEAVVSANASPYGLTAAIHTKNIDRAMTFLGKIQAGVAVVNGATYGSEPHMPFGGLKDSGTGWREAGSEALDVYSDWKTLYINFDPSRV